ncbi:hypothetical protein BM221_007017 [Beauveria bassiana]|uniref:Uncharacterized protein n=1 Tax=Beauveria bassiana TaxID=176275 RepID=A0A2N6NJ89_BEABA|nr:hypothetical protein BM221_007017 [Beauveria bassiana]
MVAPRDVLDICGKPRTAVPPEEAYVTVKNCGKRYKSKDITVERQQPATAGQRLTKAAREVNKRDWAVLDS